MLSNNRLKREAKTMVAMISMYCRETHGSKALCGDCANLQEYALQRLEKCPYQEGKTTCVKCPVHCYQPEMREKVRQVMRYAGPRMLFKHPILAVLHLLDGVQEKPNKKRQAG